MRSHARLTLQVGGSLVLALSLAFGATGCKKKSSSETLPAAAVSEAKNIFKTRCVTCHGAQGKGDGAGAAALNPKPRNYQDKAWQKSVTDAAIEKIILKGGTAVGKSALMPPNPDLEKKPDVIKALRQLVRSFAK